MKSDEPAATVTTASGHLGSDHTVHPYENRVLSARECQFLQTFPADFKWGDALEIHGVTNVRDMIGEAVPPMFTEKHGRVLTQILLGNVTKRMLAATDTRVRTARRKLALDKKTIGN
jgi:DNA (cytosine-5)-methyltransferase 1